LNHLVYLHHIYEKDEEKSIPVERGKLKQRHHFEDQVVDGIILNDIFNEQDGRGSGLISLAMCTSGRLL
jgi:hypothetical protein